LFLLSTTLLYEIDENRINTVQNQTILKFARTCANWSKRFNDAAI